MTCFRVQIVPNIYTDINSINSAHVECEIVKRIYREYLEGSSMLQIARGLKADGILTGAGNPRWHTSTINKILRNEKYIGDSAKISGIGLMR